MISICLPTRGRPGRFAEMYHSALETATGPVEVVAVFDDDDGTRFDYPEGPTYITAHNRKQSDLWNVAWEHATGDLAHMSADDRTPGWDTAVEQAFTRWKPPIGMVYVNDLDARISTKPFIGQTHRHAQGGRYVFACNPFVSREWIAALGGFFTPPYYRSWEADTWIYQLAEGISRGVYLHDVVIEHLHPMNGKAEVDATYDRGVWDKPALQRAGWRRTKLGAGERKKQISALTKAIQDARVKV